MKQNRINQSEIQMNTKFGTYFWTIIQN